MGTRVTFLGPPILQVEGEKFLTRNELMRSLLGHLGRDRFHSFRGFKVPLLCPKVVGGRDREGRVIERGT